MKKIFMLAMCSVVLGSLGCNTLGKPLVVPDEDPELKIEKPEPKPVRLPPAKTNVDAKDINDANYQKQANDLDAEMSRERKFVSPAK